MRKRGGLSVRDEEGGKEGKGGGWGGETGCEEGGPRRGAMFCKASGVTKY